MRKVREITEKEQRTLKQVTGGAYTLAGGITCILPFTRIKASSTLTGYASLNEEDDDSFIPIDIVIDVSRRANSPFIIKEMAAMLGYGLVPMAEPGGVSQAVTEAAGYRVMKETMDVVQAIHDGVARNSLDAADRKRIGKEILEAMRELESLQRALAVEP